MGSGEEASEEELEVDSKDDEAAANDPAAARRKGE